MKIGVLDIQGSVEEHLESLRKLVKENRNGISAFESVPKKTGKSAISSECKPKRGRDPSLGDTTEPVSSKSGKSLAQDGELKIEPVLVKTVKQLRQVRGLIIPGGESTTIGKLLRRFGLREEIIKLAGGEGGGDKKPTLAVWGTCAGAILLAKKIVGRESADGLKLMDIVVERNAYGRQLESFEAEVEFGEAEKVRGGSIRSSNVYTHCTHKIPAVFIRAPRIVSVGEDVKILAQLKVAGDAKNQIVAARQKSLLVTNFHPELSDSLEVHRYFVEMCGEVV